MMIGEMQDFTAPMAVQVQLGPDYKTLWVNVDRVCVLRCCQIGELTLDDMRADLLAETTT